MEKMNKTKLLPDYPNTFMVTITAMMTALVAITTFAIQLYIPATSGYFNIGEIIIYTSAIIFGPIIGGISGGVGAAIADLIGYPIYAPGTLVIKFLEGFIIGFLVYNIDFNKTKKYWRFIGIGIGVLIGSVLALIGINYYSATWEIGIIYLGTIEISVSSIVWIILGIVSGGLIIFASLRISLESAFYSIIILIGGSVMVLGYFIYEYFILYSILSIELIAFAEIPLNFGQALIGLVVSVPIIKILKKSIPSLDKNL